MLGSGDVVVSLEGTYQREGQGSGRVLGSVQRFEYRDARRYRDGVTSRITIGAMEELGKSFMDRQAIPAVGSEGLAGQAQVDGFVGNAGFC